MRKIASKRPRPFQRLNAPYRMVFINDETMEEAASFRLTKGSMYTFFSMLFIIVVAATLMIMLLTPLKYYIPGYGSRQNRVQVLQLKQKIDSLGDMVQQQQKQADEIHRIIGGKDVAQRDTTMLSAAAIRDYNAASILPQPVDIKRQAAAAVKQAKSIRRQRNR